MLLYAITWVSLIWMHFTEVRTTPLMGTAAAAVASPSHHTR